jgi:hypothetical protein
MTVGTGASASVAIVVDDVVVAATNLTVASVSASAIATAVAFIVVDGYY